MWTNASSIWGEADTRSALVRIVIEVLDADLKNEINSYFHFGLFGCVRVGKENYSEEGLGI